MVDWCDGYRYNHIQHIPVLHDILVSLKIELLVYPVKVSKKQLKNAEKKREKDDKKSGEKK